VVIGAVAFEYLVDLFGGGLPGVTEAFSTSPILNEPTQHPLPFVAAGLALLVFTLLLWGAAHEQQRRVSARAGQVRRAILAGVRAAQLDETTAAMLAAGDVAGTFLLATEMHEQNRSADAIALYQLVVKRAPKHFGANFNLSLVFAESDHYEKAEEYCRAAIVLNPESAEAQGLLGYVLYRLGYLPEAQRRARLAVRMGFPSQMLELLIKPGLGVTSSLPTVSAKEKGGS
jgi:tetratricopeptide (TPR) repeat protein